MANDNSDNKSPPPPVKKPYAAAELIRWGSLSEITRSNGWSGSSDGAKRLPNRTHF
jgi:hypothetical protein